MLAYKLDMKDCFGSQTAKPAGLPSVRILNTSGRYLRSRKLGQSSGLISSGRRSALSAGVKGGEHELWDRT